MPATVIIITGNPTTGKTSVAKKIQESGYFCFNLFDFAKRYECVETYDEEREAWVVDTDKLHLTLDKYLGAGHGIVIIEGHYADVVPEQYVSKVFVLTAPIPVMKERMKARGYSDDKINENALSEIMMVQWTDSLEAFGAQRVTKVENMEIQEIADLVMTYIHINLGA